MATMHNRNLLLLLRYMRSGLWAADENLISNRSAKIGVEDKDGDSPFDYAVFRNYKEFQEMLIAYGAIIRDRQSSVERNWQMIQEGQEHVRAMQTLFNLINKKNE